MTGVRLSAAEAKQIRQTIASATSKLSVRAVAVYGSRIAGYARSDSDYDLLVVARDYRRRVRYLYLEEPAKVSALFVDEAALEADAERAALGEFVAGRLLNPYVDLEGGEVLRRIEQRFKRRVILEALAEIVAGYGEFAAHILVPASYFLFEKLRKRAAVYPPALYSYVMTYGQPRLEANLAETLTGFQTVLSLLGQEGLLVNEADGVRVAPASLKRGPLTRLAALLAETRRGITQYAVHGYAGRVSLDVISREATSKMERSRDVREIPDYLRHPRNLWQIEEGLLIVESEDWLAHIIQRLGLSQESRVKIEPLGEAYGVSKVFVLADGARQHRVVVKNFRDVWSFKWVLLNLWALPSKRFSLTALARLEREYSAILTLRRLGFRTPRVVAVVLSERLLVTDFVGGAELGKLAAGILSRTTADGIGAFREYGRVLALVHQAGMALGDTKPSNAILTSEGICLTDLEQAVAGGDAAWDIAEFLYFVGKLTLNLEGVRAIGAAFLQGYSTAGDRAILGRALNLKYLAPFQPLLAPHVTAGIRALLREYAKG